MAAGTILITQGTQTGIPIDTVGGTTFPISKIDVGNIGSSIPWQGQVTQTVGTQNVGTMNTGTINTGTVDTVSQTVPNAWATTVNSGTSTFGTLKAGIGGSVISITDLVISMSSAGTVALYNGGTANPVFGTFYFNANGGLINNLRVPVAFTSGSPVTYQQVGNTQTSIFAAGFIK